MHVQTTYSCQFTPYMETILRAIQASRNANLTLSVFTVACVIKTGLSQLAMIRFEGVLSFNSILTNECRNGDPGYMVRDLPAMAARVFHILHPVA